MASVKANPRMVYVKKYFDARWFWAVARTQHPQTVPIPTPAPPIEIVASPEPINFIPVNNIFI